jgi:hypothetical protein
MKKTADSFVLNDDHKRWARSANRKYGGGVNYWLCMIRKQRGLSILSKAPLLFDATSGTPVAGGHSQHPLYAVVDHCSPGIDEHGHQIVSNDLNDLKGHLPVALFSALRRTSAWRELMKRWRKQALCDPGKRAAFHALRGAPYNKSLKRTRSARRLASIP